MKLNPAPALPVRIITTAEGKFLNLADMKDRMMDEGVIDTALSMFLVGRDRGDDLRFIIRQALGSFVMACAGEDKKI